MLGFPRVLKLMATQLCHPKVIFPGVDHPFFSEDVALGYEALVASMSESVKARDVPYQAGRFGTVTEPARKVRVFAMVDQVRQRCLYPFHEWAMECLRTIPQDGTFNQTRPLMLLDCDRMERYCYDLTAATDRFPILIQGLFLWKGERLARAWNETIVTPPFWYHPPGIRDPKTGKVTRPKPYSLEYQVGQPLGALSSWPIFTLCHHAVVQGCAADVHGNTER